MTLHISATTNCSDLSIDYITVRLKSGEEVSLNWDKTEFDLEDGCFDALYLAVCFGEECANGRLAELEGMEIIGMQLHSHEMNKVDLVIHEMVFEDDCDTMIFREPYAVYGDEANG